jgi:hypothetical protein
MESNTTCVEIVQFQFAPGPSLAQQKADVAQLAAWAAGQPCFHAGQLLYNATTQRWMDMVTWADAATAKAAMAKSMQDPSLAPVMMRIDPGSVQLDYYEPL